MSDYTGKYVDGFVLPVAADQLHDYKRISEEMARLWKEHGALEYVECIADDVKPGKVTSFPQAVDLKPGEVVAYARHQIRNARTGSSGPCASSWLRFVPSTNSMTRKYVPSTAPKSIQRNAPPKLLAAWA